MALKSNNTAIAVKIQSARDVFDEPNDTTDLLRFSNCRLQIDGVTIANDEYTGSPFKNADDIAGKRVTLSFNVKMRPPSSLPALDAFVPGRLLQAAKFTEVRTATAIPASAEALGVGSDATHAVLGSSASTTNDIYKGFPLILSDNGSTYKERLTAIRDYVGSTKTAELMEELGAAPAANYQIPTFIGYFRDVTSADPEILSLILWMGGYRLDLVNCGVTGFRWVIPTSTKQQAAYPEFEFTLDCTIDGSSDEATPSIPAGGAVPLLKDADVWLNQQRVGTSTVSIELGLEAEYPPNANQPDGTDAPEIAGGTATGSLTMQKYLKATLDTLSLADAQAYHPFFMQWGNGAWNTVQITIPDARLNFPNPDLSGGTIMENLGLFIDVLDRNLGIVFPGS
jgi:hypothetical protein